MTTDADKRKAERVLNTVLGKWVAMPNGASYKESALAIATALAEEREAERERCAQIAEQDSLLNWAGGSTGNAKGTAIWIAAAIRTP